MNKNRKYNISQPTRSNMTYQNKTIYYSSVTSTNGKTFRKKDVEKIVNKYRLKLQEKMPRAKMSVLLYKIEDGDVVKRTKGFYNINENYDLDDLLYDNEDVEDYRVRRFLINIVY